MGFMKRLLGRQEEASWQTQVQATPVTPAAPAPAPIPNPATQIPNVPGFVFPANVQAAMITGAQAQKAVQGIETAMNMDLDGDGKIGGVAPAPGAPPPATPMSAFAASANAGAFGLPATGATTETTVVSQLERLAALHASGALTDEEFQTQKARVLSQIPPTGGAAA